MLLARNHDDLGNDALQPGIMMGVIQVQRAIDSESFPHIETDECAFHHLSLFLPIQAKSRADSARIRATLP